METEGYSRLFRRIRRVTVWAGYLCALLAVVVFSRAIWGRLVDDNYITLRYALNLANGHGLVYNVGESHLGTSGPLWAILIGLAGWIGKLLGHDPHSSIPVIVQVGNAIAVFATCAGLIHIFASRGRVLWGLASGLLYPWVSLVYYGYAFEVMPQMALVVWAYHFYLRSFENKRPAFVAAGLLSLATLVRPDGVIWFLPVLGHFVLSNWNDGEGSVLSRVRRSVPWKEMTLCLLLLGAGALLFWVLSGHIVPSTYAAKHAQALSRGMVDGSKGWDSFGIFVTKLIADVFRWTPFVLLQVVLGLSLLGMAFVALEVKRGVHVLSLLIGGCLIYVTIYALKLPGYTWYAVPIGLGLAVLAGLGVSRLIEVPWGRSKLVGALSACSVLWFGWQLIQKEVTLVEKHRDLFAALPRIRTYQAFGKWLSENSSPGDTVGLVEVGIIGWEAPNVSVVDQLMLVSPGDLSSITRKVYHRSFQQSKPDYIVQSWQIFEAMDNRSWFQNEYTFVTGFSLEGMRQKPLSAKDATKLDPNKTIVLDVWRRKPSLAASKTGR